MDTVTLAEAATLLLAAKAGESASTEAGKAAWRSLERLYNVVRRRAGDDDEASEALDDLAANQTPESIRAATSSIARLADTDSDFREELEAIVGDTSQKANYGALIAHASDHAKQVNISGDNSGPITM